METNIQSISQLSKRDYWGLGLCAFCLIILFVSITAEPWIRENIICKKGDCYLGGVPFIIFWAITSLVYLTGALVVVKNFLTKWLLLVLGLSIVVGFTEGLFWAVITFTYFSATGSMIKRPVYRVFSLILGLSFLFCKFVLNLF